MIHDGVTSIGECAFCGCVATIKWGDVPTIRVIGNNAFYGYKGTEITIPASVTLIYEGAFSGCSSLVSITLPFVGNRPHTSSFDSYQYPFGYIFGTSSYSGGTATKQRYCGSSTSSTTYTTYYIPASLKTVTITGSSYIPHGAFYDCSNLTEITIPASVTDIGNYAFAYCTNLQTATFENPDGWEVNGYYGERRTLSSEDLRDPTTAAKYLRSTYYDYYWERS